jgi:putative SOS response-associated peptidase YedK
MMRWGLIPSWAKDEKIGDNLINTRAETISEKSSFKKPFLSQRCLIPADGFFEWQRNNKEFGIIHFFVLPEFGKNGYARQNQGNLFLTPIWTNRRRRN